MAVQGRRVHADRDGRLNLTEGDYGFDPRHSVWFARPPGMHMGSLHRHEVTEHEDGTITVTPSILITEDDANGRVQWHGYLTRGVWRTA